MMLTDAELVGLRALDTPTVCNALEIVAPDRRGWGYTTTPLVCADTALEPIVGFARTATIRAREPSGRSAEGDRDQRLAYYEHIAEPPQPTITVIEDLDDPPGYGAWWGEVNTNLHQGLGSLGVITNGSIRDLDDAAPWFQLLAGSVGPSHAFVHVVDFAVEVTVAGMTVQPGDLIHADRHGAVIIPPEVAMSIPAAAADIAANEKVLIEASQQSGFSFEVLRGIIAGDGDRH